MTKNSPKSFLLYCTLAKDEYDHVRPLVWNRNRRTLKITSLLAAGMGLLFLLFNRLTHSEVWMPYLFLFCGSALVYLLLRTLERKTMREWLSKLLCYMEMLMVCAYAGILSTQPSNYAIPATSIIVFIAVLPLSIDDRPVRMYAFMLFESAAYLVVSYRLKSQSAFLLDVVNVITFCIIGMVLYAFVCIRNVREIHQGMRVEKAQQSTISALATVVEERDESTGDHILRTEHFVQALTDAMAKQGKYAHLTNEYYKDVVLAAPMHDIGKIKIPDAILNKPGRLTAEEFEIMKRHSAYGAEIIRKTMRDVENEDYFAIACNIARYHHERFDGKGYPDGLKGEEIPLEARIMALADVYDALISERVYKKAFPAEEARRIIQEGAGTQFDPDLTQLFLECIS